MPENRKNLLCIVMPENRKNLQRALTTLPTIDSLQANPDLIETLAGDVVADLYARAASLEAALRARLLALGATGAGQLSSAEPERALRIEEAARLLNTSEDSLYGKWSKLPCAYKDPLDGKIKFSLRGIERYIASRAGVVQRRLLPVFPFTLFL